VRVCLVYDHLFPQTIGGFRETPPDPTLPCEYSERFHLDCYNRIEQQHAWQLYQDWTSKDFPRVLVMEIQHTHHPIAHGLYYEDQKAESIAYSRDFRAERIPKFLGYFERVLGGRNFMVEDRLTYVDLSMFQLIEGLRFAFPKTMKRVEADYPGLVALHDRVAARPNIAAYLKSPRRLGWNDRGVFRYYAELDE